MARSRTALPPSRNARRKYAVATLRRPSLSATLPAANPTAAPLRRANRHAESTDTPSVFRSRTSSASTKAGPTSRFRSISFVIVTETW